MTRLDRNNEYNKYLRRCVSFSHALIDILALHDNACTNI